MLLVGVLLLACLQAAPAAASRQGLLHGMPTGSSRRLLQGATAGFLEIPRTRTVEVSPWATQIQSLSVVSGVAGALAAVIAGAYTCWKWWHKKRALQANGLQQLPSTAYLVNSYVGGNVAVGNNRM
ncbi:hypothetical protein OEZ86_001245 [Tetradesmus obliquus]|nr:hypothetical protein OEZ86_001245 [Tetradesmus obliquus]